MVKVLVVDQDPDWRIACAMRWGYVASNRLIDGYDWYVISNLMLDKIKSFPEKFIVVTAHKTPKEAIKAFRLGAGAYIIKDLSFPPL